VLKIIQKLCAVIYRLIAKNLPSAFTIGQKKHQLSLFPNLSLCNEKYFQERANVVVHGSEGTDITLCVTSLAQIILNPDCRTVRGFEALIEREWLQAGHPFW
jgi:hypothetical protein